MGRAICALEDKLGSEVELTAFVPEDGKMSLYRRVIDVDKREDILEKDVGYDTGWHMITEYDSLEEGLKKMACMCASREDASYFVISDDRDGDYFKRAVRGLDTIEKDTLKASVSVFLDCSIIEAGKFLLNSGGGKENAKEAFIRECMRKEIGDATEYAEYTDGDILDEAMSECFGMCWCSDESLIRAIDDIMLSSEFPCIEYIGICDGYAELDVTLDLNIEEVLFYCLGTKLIASAEKTMEKEQEDMER